MSYELGIVASKQHGPNKQDPKPAWLGDEWQRLYVYVRIIILMDRLRTWMILL
jgi:hypothetical protein